MKQTLDITSRPKMRLGEIERLIRRKRIVVPPLSRSTLLRMCEDGTFETAGDSPTKFGWLVFEDSFLKWVRELDGCEPPPKPTGRAPRSGARNK